MDQSLEISGYGFEFGPVVGVVSIETVIHMVMDQSLLGIPDRTFYRLQLLGHVETGPFFLDHGNDRAQVPFGAFQPGYDLGVTCVAVRFCHKHWLTSLGGWRKSPDKRRNQKGTGEPVCSGKAIMRMMRRACVALSCIALLIWSAAPTSSHVPDFIEILQKHAEMIAEHGHSHGLEEDMIWAMHGHTHDAADHDHSQVVLMPTRISLSFSETSVEWLGPSRENWSPPLFRLERPPRA